MYDGVECSKKGKHAGVLRISNLVAPSTASKLQQASNNTTFPFLRQPALLDLCFYCFKANVSVASS